jgi:hypothetical protein
VLVAASAIFWKTSKYAAMAWIVALEHTVSQMKHRHQQYTHTHTHTQQLRLTKC